MQPENHRTEYKLKLTDQLEKEVVGFLNTREGGLIYIGVADEGQVVGVDDIDAVQRKIIDRIKSNIVPSVMGLFDVLTETVDDRQIIQVIILSGPDKPYYIRSKGLSPEGAFIRIGSSTQPMPIEMIESTFAKRTRASLKNIPSPRQDLSFAQLKIYYEENNLALTEQFASNLDLLTDDGHYNYFAFLLSDKNSISIKIAKYRGRDKSDLIENKEFGYCSLIKATLNVLNRFDIENVPMTQITSSIREETYPVDPVSLREAIVNAIVHNDFAREVPPVFEIYSDKIVVTSAGGLPNDMTEEEFYMGFSAPRNRELMRVFKDVQLVEHIGSGIPRILKNYDRSIFNFTTNFLRVTFPYPQSVIDRNVMPEKKNHPDHSDNIAAITGDRPAIENANYQKIIDCFKASDYITNSIAMNVLDRKPSQTRQILREMVELNLLEARGEKRYRKYFLNMPKSASGE
jgi:predicted HTH transcriptional regulator